METKEIPQGAHLESNPEFYTGSWAEKSEDHNADIKKAAKMLSIIDAIEQE